MNPSAIPWLLCGVLCLLPICVGSGSYWLLCMITNRHFAWERSVHVDEDGIKHSHVELTWLTHEELKMRKQPEEKE
jgi:hypothetical protein